jgi:hypothetical protein
MKRLCDRARLKTVDQLIRTNPDAWHKLLQRWSKLGINTDWLLMASKPLT